MEIQMKSILATIVALFAVTAFAADVPKAEAPKAEAKKEVKKDEKKPVKSTAPVVKDEKATAKTEPAKPAAQNRSVKRPNERPLDQGMLTRRCQGEYR